MDKGGKHVTTVGMAVDRPWLVLSDLSFAQMGLENASFSLLSSISGIIGSFQSSWLGVLAIESSLTDD